MSDIFVVPNLNVMYEEVYVVEWDEATCSVTTEPTVTTEGDPPLPVTTVFDINADTTQPAMAFFSRYHIEYVKLPELGRGLDNVVDRLAYCFAPDDPEEFDPDDPEVNLHPGEDRCRNEDQTEPLEKDHLDKQMEILRAGIQGWAQSLTEERTSFGNITGDPSKAINNWFDVIGKKDMNDITGDGEEQNRFHRDYNETYMIDLVPPSLMDKKERNRNNTNHYLLDNDLPFDVDETKPIQRIQFSGGGNLFSMSMSKEKVNSNVVSSCWHNCNHESETTIHGPGKIPFCVKDVPA